MRSELFKMIESVNFLGNIALKGQGHEIITGLKWYEMIGLG
jgi:hypothetical protein